MKKETIKKDMFNKKAWIGIGVFILYFIYSYYNAVPLELLGIDIAKLSLFTKVIYMLLMELLFIFVLFIIYHKTFINNFKRFIKNFKENMKEYLQYWAVAFGLMILTNFIIVTVFPNSIATNQENINSIFSQAPIYMIISAVLFAPIVEETVFRLSIRNIFKNDKLFIFISGFVFGALHVVGSFNTLVDLIYIIPYSIPGFFFAYVLVKSKNIFVPISLHLFHNGFMMLVQCILSFLI